MSLLQTTKEERAKYAAEARKFRGDITNRPLTPERIAADVETLLSALRDLYDNAYDDYAPWKAERDAEYKAAWERAKELLQGSQGKQPLLNIIGPPDWNDYAAYAVSGGSLEYEEWQQAGSPKERLSTETIITNCCLDRMANAQSDT